jgi:DNA-binding transcriptional ArsR family regulator
MLTDLNRIPIHWIKVIRKIPSFSSIIPACSLIGKRASANIFTKKVSSYEFGRRLLLKNSDENIETGVKLGQLGTSDLAQRLGTNYATTLQHLTIFKKESIVTEKRSVKTRFFRFTKILKARAVMKLLEEWEKET